MAFGKKVDYPPLLAPGRHVVNLSQIKEVALDAFPANVRRRHLYQKLEEFVQAYLVANIVCDVWINGSFLTSKPEPGDVDVTVVIDADVVLDETQKSLILRTNDDEFYPEVDAFAYQWLAKEDPNYYDESFNPALTWYEVYDIENSQEWLKGFAVIKLRETHVGLFLCS